MSSLLLDNVTCQYGLVSINMGGATSNIVAIEDYIVPFPQKAKHTEHNLASYFNNLILKFIKTFETLSIQ